MNVLFASAEAAPFAKAGGLADVVGSLPKVLRSLGVDARVVMPMYGFIDRNAYHISHAFSYRFPRLHGVSDVHVSATLYEDVPFYFISVWPFFGEGSYLYTSPDWDKHRFVHFNELALATAWQLGQGAGGETPWFPDVLHVHDWHAALAPFLVDHARSEPAWARMGTVLTIHNMGYQGDWAAPALYDAGIPARSHPDLMWQGKGDNLLGIGVAYSDIITTVSPRYGFEIQYPRFGEGLEGLARLRAQQGDVVGILNGLDMGRWNPATDPWVEHKFSLEDVDEARPPNKAVLQQQAGLPVRDDAPLIGIVSRLTDQKGFDLAIPALRRLLADTDVQVVVLGTGERWMEHELWSLSNDYGWKARAFLNFDAGLAQRIYAGSDIFLMPSRYEPCGTGQMVAMRYGSLPLVRETGGLADTVVNYDNADAERGTGFVFLWETPDAVLGTMRWALDTYRFRRDAFRRMQHRGMAIDWGWEASAKTYIEVYERTLERHGGRKGQG
ncbi:MAG: glycogen synthase [Anaerolineae bacterium]|nr:glycogen synthase [Anaerolineae bacterium]